MKNWIIVAISGIGSFIASALGGWDYSIMTLLIFLAIDFALGTLTSLVFKASTKTTSGGYSSNAGFKGLVKKGCILMVVIVANRLDGELGTTFIRDAVCMAFILNELISIIENLGLIGIPVPKIVVEALEVLKAKQESESKLGKIISNNKKENVEPTIEIVKEEKTENPQPKEDKEKWLY